MANYTYSGLTDRKQRTFFMLLQLIIKENDYFINFIRQATMSSYQLWGDYEDYYEKFIIFVMFLDIKVEEQKFKLSVGRGYNDWTWLAHYASRAYSKTIYPQGVYIPALLYLETKTSQFHPHPREKIKYYLESLNIDPQDVTVIVKIRKANHIFTDFEKKWETQAFGEERFLSEIKYTYRMSNVNRKKDFFFKVVVSYTMSPEVRGLVDEKKYKASYDIRLNQRQISATDSLFEGSIKLPYGSATHRLFYLQRQSPNQDYLQHELKDHKLKAEDFKVAFQPKFIPMQTITNMVDQDMKITDSINKNLQEKQLEAKKRNANSSLCCFSFEQLWNVLEQEHSKELFLHQYEESTKQRIKISLEKNLNQLYEIFFYYFIVENQQRDKKEDLSITYQHILHFLRDYQVFPELRDLLSFIEFYNSDYKFKTFDDTLDVNKLGIKFPQFIAILLRAIQFLQTSTFMMKGETFDSAVSKIIQKITEIERQQDEFTEFRRNIRENSKIISYVRSSCDQFKKVYSHQARTSIQSSAEQYCIKKEEVKRMLQLATVTDKNINLVVEECFSDLRLREEGVFFYQFLIICQWLAMSIITTEKDQEELENDQEQSLLIVEKIKYLIDKISSVI